MARKNISYPFSIFDIFHIVQCPFFSLYFHERLWECTCLKYRSFSWRNLRECKFSLIALLAEIGFVCAGSKSSIIGWLTKLGSLCNLNTLQLDDMFCLSKLIHCKCHFLPVKEKQPNNLPIKFSPMGSALCRKGEAWLTSLN